MELAYPPKFLTDLYFKWARTVDPLLYDNPMWWQVMEWVNLLALMPFSIIAMAGFLAKWSWIRMPAIILSSCTGYSVLLCIFSSIYGPSPTPDIVLYIMIYGPYLVFPAIVIWRVRRENPFDGRMCAWEVAVLTLLSLLTFACFFTYVLKWFAVHEPAQLAAIGLGGVTEMLANLP